MELWKRFYQRKLIQWALAYAAAAWALLQLAGFLADQFGWPGAIARGLTVVLALGLVATLVLAWYHGEQGRQRTSATEAVLLILLAALAVAGVLRFAPERRADTITAKSSEAAASRLAILPFRNISPGDRDSETLALGLHTDLLTLLSRVDGLQLVSRTDEYRNTLKTVQKIGEELGAGILLEGAVQRASSQVRISVRLVRSRTDSALWVEQYDRPWSMESLFAIQSEIVQSVAAALKTAVDADGPAVWQPPTHDEEAYALFVRSREAFARDNLPNSLPRIIAWLEQSLERDSSFAQAWALLSQVEALRFFYFHSEWPLERARPALRAAQRALSLNATLPDARVALGSYYYWVLLDYARASVQLESVLREVPNHQDALIRLAGVRRREGRMEDAAALFERGAVIDPRSPSLYFETGQTLDLLRRFTDAEAFHDRAVTLAPEEAQPRVHRTMHYLLTGNLRAANTDANAAVRLGGGSDDVLAVRLQLDRLLREYAAIRTTLRERQRSYAVNTQLQQHPAELWIADSFRFGGEPDSARAYYQKAKARSEEITRERPKDERAWSALALACAGLGEAEPAHAAAQRAIELMPLQREFYRGAFRWEELARVHARLGHEDQAIAILEDLMRRPAGRAVSPALLRHDPEWDALRSDPRFQKLANWR